MKPSFVPGHQYTTDATWPCQTPRGIGGRLDERESPREILARLLDSSRRDPPRDTAGEIHLKHGVRLAVRDLGRAGVPDRQWERVDLTRDGEHPRARPRDTLESLDESRIGMESSSAPFKP